MKSFLVDKLRKPMARILVALMAFMAVIGTTVGFSIAATSSMTITEAGGWFESAYAEWSPVSGAAGYVAYVKNASSGDSSYTKLDDELIRQYSGYWRADAVGLKAGSYTIKVAAVNSSGKELSSQTKNVTVNAYDRSGFAFSSKSKYKTGSGAYNDDGTLKDGAQVIYVTPDTAKTVTLDVVTSSKGSTTTCKGIQAILAARQKGYDTTPLDVRIVGCIKASDVDYFASSSEGIQIKGNKAYSEMNITIEGIGEDACVKGFGFLIRNCGNLEIRNIGVLDFMDDGISLDTNNCNIWVHNVDLYYGQTGSDSDQKKGDGSIDVKAASTNVTVSYCHFYDSGKCSLCGMSDSSEFLVTYHHNWFDHSDSRHARIRVASVHLYNNYYDGNSKYGVGVTKGSSAFVENNFFRSCKNPMMSSMQGTDALGDGTFSGENGGMIKAYNNVITGAESVIYANAQSQTGASKDATEFDAYLASSRSETVPSSYKTVQGQTTYNNFDTSQSYDLGVDASKVDAATSVPSIVTAYSGTQGGGVIPWTFSDSDDTSYAVDNALKAAVEGYSSSLVAIGGFNGKASANEATTAATTKATTAATTKATTQAATTATTTKATTATQGTITAKSGDIYVSPNGKSTAKGSASDPMDIVTAINSVKPGYTIWMAAGTYNVYKTYGEPIIISESNSGSAGKYKTISSINGGEVVLDFTGMSETGTNRGIVLDGSYWHFYDIDITNAGDNGMLLSGDNNVIELCQFFANHDTGLQLSRYNTSYSKVSEWPSNNLVLNCTAYNNKDDATSENADGFAAKLTCGNGNVFDGCIAYCNSDDGWDLYAKTATGPIGVVTIRNCIAFGNGKLTTGVGSANGDMNGFKLGGSNGAVPTPHVVENCLAFNNGATGFTDNGNGGAVSMKNCTAVYNGVYDSNKANYMCYRTSTDAKYTNILSLAKSTTSATDQFKGVVKNTLYHYNGLKTNNSYYWVKSWTCSDGAKTKYTGSEAADYTVTTSDFKSVTVPGYNSSNGTYATNYHKIFRNDDGSINVNGLFEVSSSSKLYSAGLNGTYIGANFTKAVITENPAGKPVVQEPVTEETTKATTAATTKATEATTKATEATTQAAEATSGVTHNFTTNGKTSDTFTIAGNLSTSKGTVKYNGLTLTQCLKMESATSIKFSTSSSATLTLVFNSSFSGNVNVDGTAYAASNGVATISIGSGSHTITKKDVSNLYYIALSTSGTTTTTKATTAATTKATTAATTQATTAAQTQATQSGANYSISYTKGDCWGTGYVGSIVITNTGSTPISGWKVKFNSADTITSAWGATLGTKSGNTTTLTDAGYNSTIPAGGSVTIGFIATCANTNAPASASITLA